METGEWTARTPETCLSFETLVIWKLKMKLVPVGSVVWEVLAFWALCLADGRAQGGGCFVLELLFVTMTDRVRGGNLP